MHNNINVKHLKIGESKRTCFDFQKSRLVKEVFLSITRVIPCKTTFRTHCVLDVFLSALWERSKEQHPFERSEREKPHANVLKGQLFYTITFYKLNKRNRIRYKTLHMV